MSLSPMTIGVFIAVAVAVKLSVLLALGVAVLGRVQRWPVSGAWALQASEGRLMVATVETAPLPPLAVALMSLMNRDVSLLEISPSERTVTVRSADGSVLNYGTSESRIIRRLAEQVDVQATWSRQGGALRLECGVSGEGGIVEIYEANGSRLKTETRVTVPVCGLDRVVTRLYAREGRQA